ncbi:MAG TPA: TetR/AcrR family transcriptional regulator [Stellaceae bacterium]|nr:TetR/AcrR family transcriptional regulator [Stellaceae bacterium]
MATITDRHAALRTQLIDAAERIIVAEGLAALKARDVAREAGCATGMIYNLFEHMDELVLCVGSRTLAMLDAALAQARRPDDEASSEGAVAELVRLARAYLEFAATHTIRWRALFEHRMTHGRPLPDWFIERQRLLFAQLERPLAALLPEFTPSACRVFARTLFSAVHGIVALGLEEKLASLAMPGLLDQLAATVCAIARGRAELHAIAHLSEQ